MKKEDLNDLINKGLEFCNSGNFDEAIKCFSEAVELNQDNPDIFYHWGNALYESAKIKQDEALFRESFEKYDKATQLKHDYDSAFYKWGNALSDLAVNKKDESLFKESFEKYEKATDLKQNYAFAFNNWGVALYDFAKIKQDESLFRESCKKCEKAAEFVDDEDFFYNWGNALYDLAKIRQDESLFKESFEKYKKATDLKLDYALAFYNWGNALSDLAKIKQDESLFKESFEKYKKATDLKPDYDFAFNNWGVALYDFAKIKQDETLFRESCEKYEKATQSTNDDNYADADVFLNWGTALYDLAIIKQDKSLFKDAAKCFQKSNMEILDILVSFEDRKDREHIAQTDILYPLLDSDTNDGKFFKKTTRNINKAELDKYKNVYIRSILIISQLYVDNENEKLVAYYCTKTIVQKMLFKKSCFHLNAINYSNDPTEGKVLLEYLFGIGETAVVEPKNREYSTFAGCFIFNYDSLNQFRLYGKEDGREGTGLSLVFRNTFFSKKAKMVVKQREDNNAGEEEGKHTLFRCMYIDPETQWIDTVGHKETYLFYREKKEETNEVIEGKIKKYNEYIDNTIENVRNGMKLLKDSVQGLEQPIVEQLLINLRYLTKHIAFKEEQECRIVRVYNINDQDITISDNSEQIYVSYKPQVVNHIAKVYFGPKAMGMELFQGMLLHKNLDIVCEKSKNPLA